MTVGFVLSFSFLVATSLNRKKIRFSVLLTQQSTLLHQPFYAGFYKPLVFKKKTFSCLIFNSKFFFYTKISEHIPLADPGLQIREDACLKFFRQSMLHFGSSSKICGSPQVALSVDSNIRALLIQNNPLNVVLDFIRALKYMFTFEFYS